MRRFGTAVPVSARRLKVSASFSESMYFAVVRCGRESASVVAAESAVSSLGPRFSRIIMSHPLMISHPLTADYEPCGARTMSAGPVLSRSFEMKWRVSSAERFVRRSDPWYHSEPAWEDVEGKEENQYPDEHYFTGVYGVFLFCKEMQVKPMPTSRTDTVTAPTSISLWLTTSAAGYQEGVEGNCGDHGFWYHPVHVITPAWVRSSKMAAL